MENIRPYYLYLLIILVGKFSLMSLQAKIFILCRRLSFQTTLNSLALRWGEILSLFAHMADLRRNFRLEWISTSFCSRFLVLGPNKHNLPYNVCINNLREQLNVPGFILSNVIANLFLSIYILFYLRINIISERSISNPIV